MFYRGPFYHDGKFRLSRSVQPLAPVLMAQAVWWAAICLGAPLAAAVLLLQLVLARWLDPKGLPSVRRLVLIVMSGLALDALTVQLGLVQFRDGGLLGIPLWLVLLWISFAATVPRLQQWLTSLASQLCVFAVAAPLAYFAGAALGAATIATPLPYFAVMFAGWLALTLLWQVRESEARRGASFHRQQQVL